MKNSFLRPSRSVSQPKPNAPSTAPQQIGAAGQPDLRCVSCRGRALLQRARERAGQRHFKTVENPGDAERDDHQEVKTSERQRIEPAGMSVSISADGKRAAPAGAGFPLWGSRAEDGAGAFGEVATIQQATCYVRGGSSHGLLSPANQPGPQSFQCTMLNSPGSK